MHDSVEDFRSPKAKYAAEVEAVKSGAYAAQLKAEGVDESDPDRYAAAVKASSGEESAPAPKSKKSKK